MLKTLMSRSIFDRKEARKYDRYAQFGIIAANEAITDSGLLEDAGVDRNRIGVIWASGIGGLSTFHQSVKEHTLGDGTPRFNPFLFLK